MVMFVYNNGALEVIESFKYLELVAPTMSCLEVEERACATHLQNVWKIGEVNIGLSRKWFF